MMLLFPLAGFGHAGDVGDIKVAYGEWAPFHSQTLPGKGVSSQLYIEAFALAGITAEPVYMPWKRAYQKAKTGEVNASMGWTSTPERKEDFLFSDVVTRGQNVFFHKKSTTFDWKVHDDLRDLRIGVLAGGKPEKVFGKVVAKGTGRIEAATNYAACMKMLLAGRVDVFVCNKTVGLILLRSEFPDVTEVVYHPEPAWRGSSHLMVSKALVNGPELIRRFNEGLALLRESGRYDEIIETYHTGLEL